MQLRQLSKSIAMGEAAEHQARELQSALGFEQRQVAELNEQLKSNSALRAKLQARRPLRHAAA